MSKSEHSTTALISDTVATNILIKFINKFDGSREKLTPFLNNCKNAINLASVNQNDILLKYIQSQLEGRAESACCIKEFQTYQQLEDFLKSQFGEKKHYTALLTDLQDCRQLFNETVNQFALRVELCLSKLLTEINISLPAKKRDSELKGRIAAMSDLALHTFIIGLNPRLAIVVRCRDPETLNEAINIAISEEKIISTTSKRNSFSANNNEVSKFPRAPIPLRPRYLKPMNNTPTSTAPVCRYCKNIGHTIENCRKRQYNNDMKAKAEPQPSTSGYQYRPQQRVNFAEDNTEINDEPRDTYYSKNE